MSKTLSDWQYNVLIQAALSSSKRRQGGIAGQAFTNYKCVCCEGIFSNSNTNTPLFCNECEKTESKKISKLWHDGYFSLSEKECEEYFDNYYNKLREAQLNKEIK